MDTLLQRPVEENYDIFTTCTEIQSTAYISGVQHLKFLPKSALFSFTNSFRNFSVTRKLQLLVSQKFRFFYISSRRESFSQFG